MPDNDDILIAARTVIGRVGLSALTFTAVAQEAGISRATLYRRFPSRDELIAVVVVAELDELERMVANRLRFADQPQQTITMLVREVLDYNSRNEALQTALRTDAAELLPWLIRTEPRPTLVDIVTERTLARIADSPLTTSLHPDPATAIEFMVSAIYAELLSPARHLSHAQLADYITAAVYRP